MNVLITGCDGYIGSHIVDYLSKKQDLALFPLSKRENNRGKLVCDLLDFCLLEKIFKENDFDVIVHASAKANLNTEVKEESFFENIQMTLNLAKLSHKYQVKRFVFLSSYMVYGAEYIIDDGNMELSRPYEWYSKSKAICEEIIKESVAKPLILRLPNVVKDENNSLILDMLRDAEEKGIIEIFGKGKVSRHFLIIDDLVEFIYKNFETETAFFAPYSFKLNIKELAQKIANFTNCSNVRFINRVESEKVLLLDRFKISNKLLESILESYGVKYE